ncbi:hypothetical protein CH304_18290 [Rhodococcus sp. 15-649-1-2]|nr:hypothetical protein [Rhodococcus sp. 15-649-1-2]OZE80054.1 hypothetical protein CH304_18290 [Rhodococcus sp. 15-649-1-2]
MIKKIIAASALALGATALAATPASADGIYDSPFTSENTEHYVSAFDPAAYGTRGSDPLIISPYGANQPIYSWSFHGQGQTWQIDPAGQAHLLRSIQLPAGSSTYTFRTISVFDPFTVLDY